jgi:hypothetical protein
MPDYRIASPRASVIDAEHEGYDGLPVTRRAYPGILSAEIDSREGYDGLPLVEFTSNDLLANQE